MTAFTIVGLLFTAFLIIILVWILATDRKFTAIQQAVVVVLGALCAAFASGGFIGDAQLRASGKIQAGDFVLTAGGGFAVGILVFYGMSVLLQRLGKREGSGISYRWPDGWTFQAIVGALTQGQQLVAQFKGFSDAQLNTKLAAGSTEAETLEKSLESVGTLAKLPPFAVEIQKPFCHLSIKN